MADHVPRLCKVEGCLLPLSAAEKRLDVEHCWYHRELEQSRVFNAMLDHWWDNGATWAEDGLD